MNIEFLPTQIEVVISKSPVPILFLDSCIIIDMIKALSGKLNNKYLESYKALNEVIKTGTKAGRIICAEGIQSGEIGRTKGKEHNVMFLHEITNGIEMLHPSDILNIQTNILFEHFIHQDDFVEISYLTAFEENPMQRKNFNVLFNFIYSDNLLKELQKEKQDRTSALNRLKVSGEYRKNFKEQLLLEMTVELRVKLKGIIKKLSKHKALNYEEIRFWKDANDRMTKFRLPKDINVRIETYLNFVGSFYFFQLPYIDIDRTITTYLLLQDGFFKNGDFIDTLNAAAYLPYVDFFVTDNAFCNCINTLQLSSKYNTQVYSIRSIDLLVEDLKKIIV